MTALALTGTGICILVMLAMTIGQRLRRIRLQNECEAEIRKTLALRQRLHAIEERRRVIGTKPGC